MYSDQHVRACDAKREAVAGRPAEFFAAGRLDQGEFDDRVGRAMSAKTRADLSALFADLPETGTALVPELPAGRRGAGRAGRVARGGSRGAGSPGGGARGAGSAIEFRLDATSGVLTYLQLVHQVEHALTAARATASDTTADRATRAAVRTTMTTSTAERRP
jgi:Domain of unknown function (DUF1707)